MSTTKFSSLIFSLVMVTALFLMPIISGQMVPCLPGECTNSSACNSACKSKGYRGGVCVKMDIGAKSGACCCRRNVESQDSSMSYDANVLIPN
ncbi:unnamed protein product [Brassica oleracea var. botrytis]|uniref:Knottin scorpion toxin-like domain-containing protein n=2 Tax=Brassica oleracea TaxID=3712 RepID=A0A0D3DBW7_BRAOL|nr:PREDICTED: putative defensin-like protein 83 [Brassica oleracea var. oleracea]VDD38921.1 unnamed protein product [Brassica oleracea]